jgi:hypothetical protein
MQYYKLGDLYPGVRFKSQKDLRAIKADKHCTPKKGQWFLSGAIPQAYLAQNDLSIKYHLAKIVQVEIITKIKIIKTLTGTFY